MTYRQPRRRFLTVVGATAATACVACGDDGTAGPGGGGEPGAGGMGGMGGMAGPGAGGMGGTGGMAVMLTPAGNVADVAEGSVVPIVGSTLLIGRDAAGIYAMTSLCTHNQCDMTTKSVISAAEIRCTCHMSRFDLVGAVIQGPAQQPLRHFAATIEPDGTILVDKTMVVDASTRAPVT